MASPVKDVVASYQQLNQEWNKTPRNLEKCAELLGKLKVLLTQVTFLPTGQEGKVNKQELLVARDILEIGAQWAIEKKNIPAFERYMLQLKAYYFDYQHELPESSYKHQLLGLNLLCLLSQNRLAEFHTELELLPPKDLQSNIYIRHPVSMEQYLMEGSYNKVFLSKGNVPAESYNFFIDTLLHTIRDEIAQCIEKAYEKIGFSEAARMLFFDSKKPMQDYAQKRKWEVGADNFYVFKPSGDAEKEDENVPATHLAAQVIEYAKELEAII